jgi:hypothetical protein
MLLVWHVECCQTACFWTRGSALSLLLLLLQVPFTITPGSEQIRATIARDGLMDVFTKVRQTPRWQQTHTARGYALSCRAHSFCSCCDSVTC